jgi:hypothetical protein
MGSAVPFRRWPSLGPMVFPNLAPPDAFSNFRSRLSSSSVFLQSLSWSHLADTTAETALGNSPGLRFPSAHAGLGGPLAAGLPRPLRSAFRVSLPSWRFPPPGSAPAFFHAGSAPGIWPFEAFPSRKVCRVSPLGMNPPAVLLAVAPSDESSGRPGKSRLLGVDPFKSPLPPPMRLTPSGTGCSPGL